ncbi:MAG: rhodanese-like domain-containing protein [Fusobacteriaceae bacterium]
MMEVKDVSVQYFIKNKERYYLIDVRVPEQYLEGHIEGAVNIPFSIIRASVSLIPKERKILTYCNGGTSGGIASLILRELRLEVYNLEGGFNNYKNLTII